MLLKVVTPVDVVLKERVLKVVAEAPNGSFALLPRHIDFVSALDPGILIYQTQDGGERYLGINAGTLVKCGGEVLVATRNAVVGDNLETLQSHVERVFLQLDEHERIARTALARLEAGIVRRFMEMEEVR